MARKWEYKIIILAGHDETDLNMLGREGWEAVGVLREHHEHDEAAVEILLKRQAIEL